jgi:hypothetical protein
MQERQGQAAGHRVYHQDEQKKLTGRNSYRRPVFLKSGRQAAWCMTKCKDAAHASGYLHHFFRLK